MDESFATFRIGDNECFDMIFNETTDSFSLLHTASVYGSIKKGYANLSPEFDIAVHFRGPVYIMNFDSTVVILQRFFLPAIIHTFGANHLKFFASYLFIDIFADRNTWFPIESMLFGWIFFLANKSCFGCKHTNWQVYLSYSNILQFYG